MTSTGNPAAAHRFDLLATAPEDERVAALEAYHDAAGSRVRDDQSVDCFLRQRMARTLFRNRNALCGCWRDVQDAQIDQTVVDDDIGGFQRLYGADGEQSRVARTRADENDAAARVWIEKGRHDR